MSFSVFGTIILGLVGVTVFDLALQTEARLVNPNLNLALPPVPENETITRQLEQMFQNGTSSDCSTDEGTGISSRGLTNTRFRWTTFTVYPDPTFNTRERTLINNAMDRLDRAVPCLNFRIFPVGATPTGDYVHIRKQNSGCWSHIGRRGRAQDLNLQSPGCMDIGTIMHELIHALGFSHEHSRTDRDDFVVIHTENIRPGQERNFRRNIASQFTSFGVPYNQRSIMHYGSRAFSKNRQPTITARNGGAVGGSRDLQSTDIEKLRRMYNC